MDYTGTLLIASPHLEDPNFRMTVILVARQSENEVFGLVLNRAADKSVSDFWESVFNEPCQCKAPLYIGGPLVGPVVGLGLCKESYLTGSCYLEGDKNRIKARAESPDDTFRVFLGYAGWSVDQLAGEIRDGVWHLLPADEENIFADPSELWLRALQKSTRTSLQLLLRLPQLPEDPGVN